jgi:hypothetical protein
MSRRRLTALASALAFAALTLVGCSASDVDVRYPEAGAKRAMLASVAPRRVEISPVTDRRPDPARIGSRGGEDIVTRRPVPDIVREALAVEVAKNGHAVTSSMTDAVLAAAVEDFRLDRVDGYPSAHYVGRVVIALAVADGRTGDTVLTRRYVGIVRRQAEPDSKDAWREVMDTALARTMRDLATDPELVATLGRLAPGAAQP